MLNNNNKYHVYAKSMENDNKEMTKINSINTTKHKNNPRNLTNKNKNSRNINNKLLS